MEESLSRFLSKINAWEEFERIFNEYLTNIDEKGNEFVSSSIVLPMKYDYSMFTNDFHELGQFLITNPPYYENVLRNVILKAVNTELDKMFRRFRVQPEQIHFVYRFEHLPMLEKYKFFPEIRMSVSNFTCIVNGRGEVKNYTRQMVWQCSKKCATPLVADTTSNCTLCHKSMSECVPLRDVSEEVKITVFPVEMMQTSKRCTGTMYQKFDVVLRDDLVNFKVVYGNAYVITGTYNSFKRFFHAWNIVECEDL